LRQNAFNAGGQISPIIIVRDDNIDATTIPSTFKSQSIMKARHLNRFGNTDVRGSSPQEHLSNGAIHG
jgi:hypothetical protein